jgi:hypothetical protein
MTTRGRCAPIVEVTTALGRETGWASRALQFSLPEARGAGLGSLRAGRWAADPRTDYLGSSKEILSVFASFLSPTHQEAGCRCESFEKPRKFLGVEKSYPYNFPGIHIFKYTEHNFLKQK